MSTVYSTLKSDCVGLGQYQQRGACINLNPYLNQGVQDPCNRDTLSFDPEHREQTVSRFGLCIIHSTHRLQ